MPAGQQYVELMFVERASKILEPYEGESEDEK
jgi:hypothetical protein